MKVIYRGHEIDCHRAKAMGGWASLYYSVFRVSDGLEVASGLTTGNDTVQEYVGYIKERVDTYITDPREEFPDATDEEIEKHEKLLEGL